MTSTACWPTRPAWRCVGELGLDLKLDFMLNHLSVLSPQFQDLLARGEQSPYRDFFIDWNRFWEGKGEMTRRVYPARSGADQGDVLP